MKHKRHHDTSRRQTIEVLVVGVQNDAVFLNVPRAARTMMLDDLRVLFAHLPADAAHAD
jgi:hypothetical protein